MFDCLRAIEALPADAPANLAGEGRSIAHRTLYHSTAIATTTVNHSTSRIVNRNMVAGFLFARLDAFQQGANYARLDMHNVRIRPARIFSQRL